jgi:CelD/BcsL family acetyltransferase involved in cellulose biosynthesis
MNTGAVLDWETTAALGIEVHDSFASAEESWRALETVAGGYGFQCYDWMACWHETLGAGESVAPCIVVVSSSHGEPLMLLPLGVQRRHGLRRLMWLGGPLADYQAPLLRAPELAGRLEFGSLWARILSEMPGVDAVTLDRLPAFVGRAVNPMLELGHQAHPSAAHQALLHGSLKTFVAAKRSGKSVATDRRKERRLAEHGGIRFVMASTAEDRERLLPALFRQKSEGYRALGVADLFAEAGYRDFVTRLAETLNGPTSALLCGLMVGDRVAATCFGIVHDRRLYYLLPAYERDELTRYGPGNVLLYRLFDWCFENGVEIFDFTLGDEPYKFFWSDAEMRMFDHFQGRTLRGWAYVTLLKLAQRAKSRIKSSPRLLDLALVLRRWRAGA